MIYRSTENRSVSYLLTDLLLHIESFCVRIEKGGVKMQFPNFHEFEPYLRSIEHEVGQNASKLVIYQLEDKTPESVSAFASDVAGKTLAVANKMAIAYLAAYHQFLSDYFENRESD